MGILSSLFHKPLGFALDISDSALHLLEVKGRGVNDVTSSVHFDIPTGLVEDGRILDQVKLAEVIHRAYSEAVPQPPRTKHVVTQLPESQTFVVQFTLDKATLQKQLKDAVMARGALSLPVNLDEYACDYQILATTEAGYEILFAAAPAEIVEAYEHTLTLAGLTLEALELESSALSRAVLDHAKLAADAAEMILDMGGRSSSFVIVDRLGLQLSATLPLAGDAFTDALVKKTQTAPADAEKRKRKVGFADKEAAEAFRLVLQPLVKEIQEAGRYYEQKTARKIQKLHLAGGTSVLPGLKEELEKVLGMPVQKAVPPFQAPGLEPQELCVVSGLALRATNLAQGINFILPR